MSDLISIIVPVYNIERYLRQCIESICKQTYRELEIILVDDGSTDDSAYICDEYAKQDSRIKVLHKKNEGLVNARKDGLTLSSGQYIAYVDGDDWIEPEMYKHMYQIMVSQSVDIIMCGRYEDTGEVSKAVFHGVPEGRYGKEQLLHEIYPRMIVNQSFFEWGIFPSVWDKLFRRDCIEKFQLAVNEQIIMGEDAACTYPCIQNANSVYVLHECLYHYRQTTSSITKNIQNYELERKQIQTLYQTVRHSFEQSLEIYDFREQWKKYILFLMVPRADGLYRGYEKLDFLFPFSRVKKGAKIILYGAGTYGQRLYYYLCKTGVCKVVGWVDRNYTQFRKMGLSVNAPSSISELRYDAIVIANMYKKSRTLLYQELVKKYPMDTIHLIDEELIFSSITIKALGLE
jgi:Glycosyltransferases involved in cell wall biogenesis